MIITNKRLVIRFWGWKKKDTKKRWFTGKFVKFEFEKIPFMNKVVKSPTWLEELIKFVGRVSHSICHTDQQQRKTHKEESKKPRHVFSSSFFFKGNTGIWGIAEWRLYSEKCWVVAENSGEGRGFYRGKENVFEKWLVR